MTYGVGTGTYGEVTGLVKGLIGGICRRLLTPFVARGGGGSGGVAELLNRLPLRGMGLNCSGVATKGERTLLMELY